MYKAKSSLILLVYFFGYAIFSLFICLFFENETNLKVTKTSFFLTFHSFPSSNIQLEFVASAELISRNKMCFFSVDLTLYSSNLHRFSFDNFRQGNWISKHSTTIAVNYWHNIPTIHFYKPVMPSIRVIPFIAVCRQRE